MKERIKKLSGTSKKKLFAGSSLSFVCSYTMPHLLRRIKSNSATIKDLHHNVSITTTIILTIATMAIIILYQLKKNVQPVETLRRNAILKRQLLKSPKEKYASLKVGKRFLNPFAEWTEIPFYKTALFWMKRWKGNGIPKNKNELEKALPVVKPDLTNIKNKSSTVTFTWFGQSTCLMTIDGLTILSDPVFSKCSINDYIGPKRLRPIPCRLEEFINDVDIVVVSHDHFDHLDEAAVQKLGNSVVWYIPLGLKNWFLKRKVTNVIELDWWQEITHKARPDIKVACVPAMHWSGSRTPFEKNNTLWCSYVIQSQNNKIFFCGDTGYSPELFKAIGDLYSPFTLAAIPIGSFMPTHLMKHLHMGPEDAIKVHIDLKYPRLSVGTHWGTFMMSDEFYLAPKEILNTLWKKHCDSGDKHNDLVENLSINSQSITSSVSPTRITESQFITTAFGQTVYLN